MFLLLLLLLFWLKKELSEINFQQEKNVSVHSLNRNPHIGVPYNISIYIPTYTHTEPTKAILPVLVHKRVIFRHYPFASIYPIFKFVRKH